jgi:hypothetical protein
LARRRCGPLLELDYAGLSILCTDAILGRNQSAQSIAILSRELTVCDTTSNDPADLGLALVRGHGCGLTTAAQRVLRTIDQTLDGVTISPGRRLLTGR